MINRLKALSPAQTGDTIVEVLICTAIIALILIGAYTVVDKAYISLEDTQERSRAVKLAETQIEELRVNAVSTASCYYLSGTTVTPVTVPLSSNCTLNSDGTVDTSGSQPAYKVAITPNNPTPETYNVTVTWQGLRSMDTTSLEYRLK